MFYSPHKLLGGPGSCGLLAIRKSLFGANIKPTFAGGGTVRYVSRTSHFFIDEVEDREDAGTPGILQLIRATLAYQLRNELGFDWIATCKEKLYTHFIKRLREIEGATCYGCQKTDNIGIVSFNIKHIDPYVLCKILSESDGFQTRAGCSCAGPYGHDLLGLEDDTLFQTQPGWLRVSIHYSQDICDIDALLEAIIKSIKRLK